MDNKNKSVRFDMTETDVFPKIGWIEYHFSGEKVGFNNADAYLSALAEAYNTYPNGFTNHTITTDAAVKYEATRLAYNLFGEMMPYSLDDYGHADDRNKIKGIITYKRTGSKKTFYDSDDYVHELRELLHIFPDRGSIAFQTLTENTAVWKAVDDVIRNELHLSSNHAFEDCIHRQPMVQEMCVRDYVSKYMASGKARQRAESNKRTSETIGWMQRFEDSETAYFTSADDFVKALKVELTLHPENTDWGVLKDEPVIQKAVFDETGKVTGEGNPFYIDELGKDNPDSVKGRIIDLSTAELTEFRKSEDYLDAIRDKLLYKTDGFQFETVTENSAVWKAMDDEVNAVFGTYDEDGIEHSLARPRVSGFATFAEFVEKRMRTDDGTLERSKGELRDNQINMNECNVDMEVITECKDQSNLRKADTDIVKVSSDDLPFPDGKIKSKVPNKQKQNYRIKPEKKRSVLARLAEKQAIVKEREKNRGSKSIANKDSIQIAK